MNKNIRFSIIDYLNNSYEKSKRDKTDDDSEKNTESWLNCN